MSLTDTFDNPQSRVEAILQNAMGAEHEVVPQSRVEELLDRLNGYLERIEEEVASNGITVTGTTPTIDAEEGKRYICGEVESLTFNPSASGLCGVRFVSGTTPTVLTLPQTVKMPSWWTGTEANKTYEISISDGVYGAVMSWD